MKKYFYRLIFKYLSLYIFKDDSVLFINPMDIEGLRRYRNSRYHFIGESHDSEEFSSFEKHSKDGVHYDYIVINGSVQYERDIVNLLKKVNEICVTETRLIITYYSLLWKPLVKAATYIGLRSKHDEDNWLAPEDIHNFLLLADFEEINKQSRILVPMYIPLLSNVINRYLAPLPIFNLFNLFNISISRKIPPRPVFSSQPSVSVVVAARNEEGNIEDIVRRLPMMGPTDELIFVEGNSQDNTWDKILKVAAAHNESRRIVTAQQEGVGKGDAVRKGFSLATNEILMILDADLTVPPEDLPEFYDAIVSGKGEYINGSRLVYPMEKMAMRFFNILGNKFFALAFSFVLGQRFKDTLCGTKVLTRENYLKLATHRSYFGDFDPFGDFDLIFGSSRLSLKIVEVPIRYRERLYGSTNISRWKHGLILLRMLLFASRKFKFI